MSTVFAETGIGFFFENHIELIFNGKTLPQEHGFPLRVVAEDTYGSDWVKYVYGLEVEIA